MSSPSIIRRVWHTVWVFAAGFVGTLAIIAMLAFAFIVTSKADPFDLHDAAYLSTVHDQGVSIAAEKTDADLIALGHAVCADLQSGDTQAFVIYELHQGGASWADAGSVAGAAEGAYCPSLHAGVVA